MWQANVFTIFPDAFPGNLGVSVIKKALEQRKWYLKLIDLKKFPVKSDRIDSAPYGGGAGMILSPLTFKQAFDTLSENEQKWKKFYFSPRGRQIQQADLQEISKLPGITMLCGRYEGVDQRIIDFYDMEEISIGDFVLLGGEIVAMMLIEGCVRLLPHVIGNNDSIDDDSFQNHLLEYNQYTKPAVFNGLSVPDVLLSGNHQEITEFRLDQSKKITAERRKDLWMRYIQEKMKL
ncbi:MAG: tRNA (guanosine(37)-N1)-methyltransferase TrmD [Holosporaceae bacterium]|jgi:tRNA (guanine37-N1)-methyltransferase|nr:tRNA (guanosine(37)-N1)-methyltransferase TrmD [Holosporaceae bacterium]